MLTQSFTPIKVGIVEDEVIIADNIYGLLQEMGYSPCEPCSSYDETVRLLNSEKPDVMLLDINLTRGKSGIDVAEYIRKNIHIPFIFLTANSDRNTLDKAKTTKPNAYLVKPFQKADLYAAIELATYNFTTQKDELPQQSKADSFEDKGYLFIKDGNYFYKVKTEDILYLSSDHVYLTIHTTERKYLVRGSMQEYLSKLSPERFVRIHRSYAVNVDKVNKINSVYIELNGEKLPMSRTHRDNLMEALHLV